MRLFLLCGLALACAKPASAAIVLTTFTGVIADAQGSVGVGSPFGAITAGRDTYKLVYRIDDSLAASRVTTNTYGTSIAGTGSVTATLTINGVSRTIGGTAVAAAENRNAEPDSGRSFDRVLRSTQDFSYDPNGLYWDAYAQTEIGSYLSDFLSDGIYGTPFTYKPVSADSYLSTVHFNIFDFSTNTQITNVYLSLAPGQVVNEVVSSGVPEPTTWAMLMLGLGLVGAAARRQRHAFPAL